MKLVLKRTDYLPTMTIGELNIDGRFFCYTLEDTCRENPKTDAPFEVAYEKVQGETAIPMGTYEVIIDMSMRFGREMPHILNVPGFTGIRIHAGNKPTHTEGCILVGMSKTGKGKDLSGIGMSQIAYTKLFEKIEAAYQHHDNITIEITRMVYADPYAETRYGKMC